MTAAPIVDDLPLIGRDDVLAEVVSLIESAGQIVSLVGPPGVGKTAVSRSACIGLRTAKVRVKSGMTAEHLEVELAIASGVPNVREALETMHEKIDVVVFDAAEHALDAATLWAETFAKSGVSVIVTSRSQLGAVDERSITVEPLSQTDAIELFRSRAGIDDLDVDAVSRLVDAFDRLPLAIELAAARTHLMSTEQMIDRLDSRLDWLGSSYDDGASLQDVIARSWDDLSEREREVLCDLSVFVEPFDVEMADAVCESANQSEATINVVDRLLRRSLLRQVGEQGAPRFLMLDTIRTFVSQFGERTDAKERHANYWVRTDLSDRDFFDSFTPERNRNLLSFAAELGAVLSRFPNSEVTLRATLVRVVALRTHGFRFALLASLDSALAIENSERELRLALLMVRASLLRDAGESVAALEDLEFVLGRVGDWELLRGRALGEMTSVYNTLGRLDDADRCAERAILCFRALGDAAREARVHLVLANTAIYRGDTGGGIECMERALEILRRNALPILSTEASLASSYVAHGEPSIGISILDRLLESAVPARLYGLMRTNRGLAKLALGRLEEALEDFNAAISSNVSVGRANTDRVARTGSAMVFLELGDFLKANEQMRLARFSSRDLLDSQISISTHIFSAVTAHCSGDHELAVAHLRNAEKLEFSEGDRDRILLCRAILENRTVGEGELEIPILVAKKRPGLSTLLKLVGPTQTESRHIRVGANLHWVEIAGETIELKRRGPTRRLIGRLITAAESGGEALSVHDLFDAGWPGEEVNVDVSTNRVYQTLHRMRALGFANMIVTLDDGYKLSEEIEIIHDDQ